MPGKYTKVALKNFPAFVGKRILAAHHYYSSPEIIEQWTEMTGKKLTYVPLSPDVFKSFLPPNGANELLETFFLMAGEGYYGGADLSESNEQLDEPATTWRQYVEAHKDEW